MGLNERKGILLVAFSFTWLIPSLTTLTLNCFNDCEFLIISMKTYNQILTFQYIVTRCWKYTFPVFLLCLFYYLLFSKSVKRVSRILGIFAFTFVSLCVFVMLRSHHNFGYSSISAAPMETSTSFLNICKSLVFTCFLVIDCHWLS